MRQALAKIALPLKGRRKLTPETLGDYLRETEGRWFRLLDFEARFKVNKKTAWGYLNLLLQEGVLTHNGEKANRVRYALAAPFKANPASPRGLSRCPDRRKTNLRSTSAPLTATVSVRSWFEC